MKVFISHSSVDKRFVRTLKTDLNENGINTWFDEDELDFGDSLIEKLENSIDDTTHFIIVLSENSVNSQWVQLELKKVLLNFKKKIIPIKYKECIIPEELSHMLLADISNITRVTKGDNLLFLDDKYYDFIKKLIKSLNSQTTKLNKSEKQILAIRDNDAVSVDQFIVENTYTKLIVKGFLNNESKDKYVERIKNNLNSNQLTKKRINLNKPILLPHVFKKIYNNINLGDQILVRNNSNENKVGLFAGFRTENDNVIILPSSIRSFLSIPKSEMEFNTIIVHNKFEIIITV